MAGFDDLPALCQPAYWKLVEEEATAGRAWEWNHVDYLDAAGDPIPWDGVSATCEVVNPASGAVVLALDVTFQDPGAFRVSRGAAFTGIPPGLYGFRMTFTKGTVVVLIHGGPYSTLDVRPA